MATTVKLDIAVIRETIETDRIRNAKWKTDGDDLLNADEITVLGGEPVTLAVCLPGTDFVLLKRLIDPREAEPPAVAEFTVPRRRWRLHPPTFTNYEPFPVLESLGVTTEP